MLSSQAAQAEEATAAPRPHVEAIDKSIEIMRATKNQKSRGEVPEIKRPLLHHTADRNGNECTHL